MCSIASVNAHIKAFNFDHGMVLVPDGLLQVFLKLLISWNIYALWCLYSMNRKAGKQLVSGNFACRNVEDRFQIKTCFALTNDVVC